MTTVFSSLIGLFQQDIKKVIAYSTMSQLGMMIIAIGLSSYNIALYHLVNHAFYKGLLFLGAGAVIHAIADNQDFRKYGGLRPFLPLTYSVMLIASISLFIHPLHEIALDTEFAVPTLFKLLPLIFTIVLSIISIVIFEYLSKLLIIFKFSSFGYNIFSFFNQRFLIELFYNKYVVGFILKLGGHTTKVIDKGSVELLGPYGLEKGLLKLSKSIASLDTGVIK